jgi:hypothetical protein
MQHHHPSIPDNQFYALFGRPVLKMCTHSAETNSLTLRRKLIHEFLCFKHAIIGVIFLDQHPGLQSFLLKMHLTLDHFCSGQSMLMLNRDIAGSSIIK